MSEKRDEATVTIRREWVMYGMLLCGQARKLHASGLDYEVVYELMMLKFNDQLAYKLPLAIGEIRGGRWPARPNGPVL